MNLISKDFIRNIVPQLNLLNTLGGGVAQAAMRVDKREKGVVVRVAVPSVRPENFHVVLANNVLTVYAEYRHSPEDTVSAPLFSRVLTLPSNLDLSRIDAVFEGQELHVRIPYRNTTDTPREINIKQR
ncbi:Hsp20/alpha crystallin family protein [Hymenobacter weizhouensis]|uniref:Hsp20/alpha crystallin family protein n=1 Tax=Hymenobacter sp. YIM 151500-1 TaxID=2987689 RepID=UPI0022271B87|nr:Hsp20/alpha crystallin family protein [Hymenobacter sp. YIM 151500-1]UYZ62429.1 Hsp20/alpha crystallin family protein [Hymenobacter sp. YIM 151500-1]